jgi:hypothetical protein
MKNSIKLIYCTATIVLCFLSPIAVANPGLSSFKDKISDVSKLGAKAGAGIIKKVPDLIPTPENVYSLSKQTLIGLPFELLLSGIDKLCKSLYFIFYSDLTQAAQIVGVINI